MTNSEKVLNYLEGSMSAEEQSEFESILNNDPDLQEEFGFQQEIISTIKTARRQELKAMLNSVVIPSTSSSVSKYFGQTVAGLMVAGTVIYGIYSMTSQNNTSDSSQNEQLEIASEKSVETPTEDYSPNVESGEQTQLADVELDEGVSSDQTTSLKAEQDQQQVEPQIEVPNGMENISESNNNELIVPVPDTELSEEIKETENVSVEVVTDDKNHSFHYKFKNDQLFLFGDFENTYEILDFQNNDKRAMYLFYQGLYYSLSPSNKRVTPLEKVTDISIISDLDYKRNQ